MTDLTNPDPAAAVESRDTFDVQAIKKDFPILDQTVNGNPLVYLDSAASSQRPSSVIDAMTHYYETSHANVHRSVYRLAEQATAAYEGARKKIAAFINAGSSRQVLFGKNVTEQINLVARTWGAANLKRGDAICITEMEHHANLIPWIMLANEKGLDLRYLTVDDDGLLDVSDLDRKLDGVKLFAFTGVSNVLGTINPVADLAARARAAGAVTVVDMAQWTPHMPTDMQALGVDFAGFTAHKLLGPTGIGVLWGREELLTEMPPFLGGGDMISDVTMDSFTTNDLPWKFEAGTPPIAEAVGLGAAIDYLSNLGMDAIRTHERQVTEYAIGKLEDELGDGIKIHGPRLADQRAGVISFDLPGVHPHDVAQVLSEEGVCIRASHHCAKPLHKKLGVAASARASFYVYNDESDADALVAALHKAKKFFA